LNQPRADYRASSTAFAPLSQCKNNRGAGEQLIGLRNEPLFKWVPRVATRQGGWLVLVKVALFVLFALAPWSAVGPSAGSRVSFEGEPQTSECGSAKQQGPSFDDPNVDTDPERPITELASLPDDEGDDSDDYADGMCRSETLELWFQPQPNVFIQALAATSRAQS